MLFHLLFDQMPFGNLELFLTGIAWQGNDLHPVEQRPGNGIQGIRRGDEKNLAQVKRDFQIMIVKRHVLLAIQHFKHSGRRIALIIGPHFINFIQQYKRIVGLCLLHPGNNPSRHSADISFAVPADFGFIPDASQ